MWQGDAYLESLYQEAERTREQACRHETPEERKSRLKAVIAASLGSFERTNSLSPVELEEARCEGYIRKRIEMSVIPGLSFPSYVLIPEQAQGPLPGVIAIHGHGYGSRQICGMKADGSPDNGEPDLYNHFAVQLVRKGMIVIAPDVIGFGERRMQADLDEDPNAPSSCYRMATRLLMLGKTLTGLRITELGGVLDYFGRRADVDASRIGIVGFSGGSLLAYTLAALDERIRASVLIGFPNTFRHSILAVHHCACNYTPGILMQAEQPELMGVLAPRPLFLESGARDPIFPARGFREALKQLQEIYDREGAGDNLASDLFPGVHEVSGRRSFDWLKQQLLA